ncbi:mechanosensitive ion channel [Phormidium sp. FACHB-592]|uniref:Mechanosensitive ion channel n=1 Tax=Stenomitos frigidus AS-A4 TaxID=2933935 RepID=A0ABV0KNL9_9CYAN|nr:mechanosensitive ion channel [Phormidium sp. FACHB-592]MBD2073142.1 mechanosensitive ion channel [Phormidium sp. FACHB-592]
MNEILQQLGYVSGIQTLIFSGALVAQTPSAAPVETNPVTPFLAGLGLGSLGPTLLNLLGAILILVVGLLVALILSKVVGGLLKKTDIDNRIAASIMGQRPGSEPFPIEKVLASVVFWIVAVVAAVAFLDALNLTTVSQPLNNFLNQIFSYLPKLGSAAILVAIAWLLATLAKTLVTRVAQGFGLDERLSQTAPPPPPATPAPTYGAPNYGEPAYGTTAPAPTETQFSLSETLGTALYWLIFLFFLPLILGVLDLQGPLQPVQNLLNEILAALPKILKAVLIGVVGWVIARIVRGIVTNLLTAAGADRLGARFGLSRSSGGQSLSWIIGTIVYVLILIPTATAALDALQIPSISGPATAMLNQILNALPQIFTAVLILVAAYVIGKFVAELVTNILTGIGFNNVFNWLGLQSTPSTPGFRSSAPSPSLGDPTTLQDPTSPRLPTTTRTPSEIVGVVVLVGIVLFAAVAAIDVLNFPGLKTIVVGLLAVFGQILAGLIVFAIGLYLANLAFSIISSSNTPQSKILGQTARVAIIALVSAMALQQMGIAPNIVNLAFGLLLGAVAVAIAIAFGLGGRDAAGEQVREWLASFKQNR